MNHGHGWQNWQVFKSRKEMTTNNGISVTTTTGIWRTQNGHFVTSSFGQYWNNQWPFNPLLRCFPRMLHECSKYMLLTIHHPAARSTSSIRTVGTCGKWTYIYNIKCQLFPADWPLNWELSIDCKTSTNCKQASQLKSSLFSIYPLGAQPAFSRRRHALCASGF